MRPNNKRILLVEDNEELRDIYLLELKKIGFIVDTALDGVAALTAVSKGAYDLLLLDIMMPNMNGVDLIKRLKLKRETRDIPTYFLTNMEKNGILQEGLRAGANGYFIKSDHTAIEIADSIKEIIENIEQ